MKPGRPTKYKPAAVARVAALAAKGATLAVIADRLGVAVSTIELWANVHPEFSEAIKDARAIADLEVANSLYNRARGAIEVTETRTDAEGHVATITKRLPPDPVSAIFWLCNRDPAHWRRNRDAAGGTADGWVDPNEAPNPSAA